MSYALKQGTRANDRIASNVTRSREVIGDIGTFQNLIATDTTTISGDIVIQGDTYITICGDTNISGITVIEGNTTIEGDTIIQGNTTICGDSFITGILGISGDTEISGDVLIVGNLTLSGGFDLCGDLLVDGNLVVTKTTTTNETVYIREEVVYTIGQDFEVDVCFNQNVTVLDICDGRFWSQVDASFSRNVEVSGEVFIGNDLTVDGETFMNDDLTISGSLNINSDLIVPANVRIGGDLNVSGDQVIDGILDVNTSMLVGNNPISGFTFSVGGDSRCLSDLNIGQQNSSALIRFHNNVTTGPPTNFQRFNQILFGKRINENGYNNELLFFCADEDPALVPPGTSPNRIRFKASRFVFQGLDNNLGYTGISNGQTRMTIMENGTVGIGTATPDLGFLLDVNGNTNISSGSDSTAVLQLVNNSDSTGNARTFPMVNLRARFLSSSSTLNQIPALGVYRGVDGTVNTLNLLVGNGLYVNNTTGNVGVNSPTPQNKLDVVGNTRLFGNVGMNVASINSDYSADVSGTMRITTQGNGYCFQMDSRNTEGSTGGVFISQRGGGKSAIEISSGSYADEGSLFIRHWAPSAWLNPVMTMQNLVHSVSSNSKAYFLNLGIRPSDDPSNFGIYTIPAITVERHTPDICDSISLLLGKDMYINSATGNVGVRTKPYPYDSGRAISSLPSSEAPLALDVNGSIRLFDSTREWVPSDNTGGNQFPSTLMFGNDYHPFIRCRQSNASYPWDSFLDFYVAGNSVISRDTTTLMSLRGNTRKVGINNSFPEYQLDVGGDTRIIGTLDVSSGSGGRISLQNQGTSSTESTLILRNETITAGNDITIPLINARYRWNSGSSALDETQSLSIYRRVDGTSSSANVLIGSSLHVNRGTGFVGINQTNPQYELDVNGEALIGNTWIYQNTIENTTTKFVDASTNGMVISGVRAIYFPTYYTNNSYDATFGSRGIVGGRGNFGLRVTLTSNTGTGTVYDFDGNIGNDFFTGQHACKMVSPQIPSPEMIGLIVSSEKRYFRKNTLENTQIQCSISTKENDKNCYGVLAPKDSVYLVNLNYPFTDRLVKVNSLGEGEVYVCDIRGFFEAGEYITTSKIPGMGCKQHDDVLHNYTVAKATVDFVETPDVYNIYTLSDELFSKDMKNGNLDEMMTKHYNYETVQHSNYTLHYIQVREDGYTCYEDEAMTKELFTLPHDFATLSPELVGQTFRAARIGCTYHCG